MLDGPRVRVVSPVVKEKVYGGKDLLKSIQHSFKISTVRNKARRSRSMGVKAGMTTYRVGRRGRISYCIYVCIIMQPSCMYRIMQCVLSVCSSVHLSHRGV